MISGDLPLFINFLRQQGNCCFCGSRGVARVSVRADLTAVFVRDRCAADHDLDVFADALGNAKVNDVFHFRHGGGEERRASDDIGVMLFCGGNVSFGSNVNAEVNDLKTVSFHHHLDEILTDIVEISANRTENDLADGLHVACNEMGLEDFRACLHRSCRDEDLGNEDLIVFESYADDAHACEQTVIQNILCGDTFFERLGNERFDILGFAVLQFEGNFL